MSTLPSARQYPSYGDCVEVKKEYYQNCSVLDCVTQCSQSAAHLYDQFLQVQQCCVRCCAKVCFSFISFCCLDVLCHPVVALLCNSFYGVGH